MLSTSLISYLYNLKFPSMLIWLPIVIRRSDSSNKIFPWFLHCEAGNRAVNWLDINFCKKEPLSRLTRLLVVKNRPKISGNVTFTKNFLRQEISWKRNVFSEYCQKFSILYSLFDLHTVNASAISLNTQATVNIYLFKPTIEALEKDMKYVQS